MPSIDEADAHLMVTQESPPHTKAGFYPVTPDNTSICTEILTQGKNLLLSHLVHHLAALWQVVLLLELLAL